MSYNVFGLVVYFRAAPNIMMIQMRTRQKSIEFCTKKTFPWFLVGGGPQKKSQLGWIGCKKEGSCFPRNRTALTIEPVLRKQDKISWKVHFRRKERQKREGETADTVVRRDFVAGLAPRSEKQLEEKIKNEVKKVQPYLRTEKEKRTGTGGGPGPTLMPLPRYQPLIAALSESHLEEGVSGIGDENSIYKFEYDVGGDADDAGAYYYSDSDEPLFEKPLEEVNAVGAEKSGTRSGKKAAEAEKKSAGTEKKVGGWSGKNVGGWSGKNVAGWSGKNVGGWSGKSIGGIIRIKRARLDLSSAREQRNVTSTYGYEYSIV
ncbi:hypothetical protein Aduo_018259 [Ancylostoma duodenale]